MSKFLIIMFLVVGFTAKGQSIFKKKTFKSKGGELLYQVLLPQNFSKDKKYPVVLFLHGAGERGNDNEKQLVHGSKLFLNDENRDKYPAIVIFPQCPKDQYWSNVGVEYKPTGRQFNFKDGGEPTVPMALVLQLLDSMSNQKFVDKKRIYVGGLSMGGMGTFELLARRPDTFAAAFPICGGGNPESAEKYASKVSLWIFHGAKDDVVYPDHSVAMALALQKAGAAPKFTLYKDANHNSWDPAFSETELFPWLFSQSKKN